MSTTMKESQKSNKSRSAKSKNKLTIDELIGQTIDPSLIESEWTCEKDNGGYRFEGTDVRKKLMTGKELLALGVFQIGGSGMPVILHATVNTDSTYSITSIDIDAYASNGPEYGRPIYVDVTSEDRKLVAKMVERFLTTSKLVTVQQTEGKKYMFALFEQSNAVAKDYILRAGNITGIAKLFIYDDEIQCLVSMGRSMGTKQDQKELDKIEDFESALRNDEITREYLEKFSFKLSTGTHKCIMTAETAEEIDNLCAFLSTLLLKNKDRIIEGFDSVDDFIAQIKQSIDSEEKFNKLSEKINSIQYIS